MTGNSSEDGLLFVHAADLHLGSPFVGVSEVSEDIAALLQRATFTAFENVVDLCIERRADFLLVAGDVYDGCDRSLGAQLAFRNGLRKLAEAGTRSYVVHGNHDPLDGWASSLEWPEGVHVFRAQLESVTYARDGQDRAVIHGVSFPHVEVRENLATQFHAADSPLPQIGLLHCNVGANTGHEPYAPCTVEDLTAAGMDYWALGHVHTRAVLSAEKPTAIYPGNTQGRHVNEAGPRGCYVVHIDRDRHVQAEFAPVDAARWSCEAIDISPFETDEHLLSAIEDAVRAQPRASEGRPTLCTLALTGRGPLHAHLMHPNYVQDLLEEARRLGHVQDTLVWITRIEDRTRMPLDRQQRSQSEDIVGGLLRIIDDYRLHPEKLGEPPECLKPLLEHRACRWYVQAPSAQELLALLEDAEACCLDRLLKEDGA